MSGQTEVTVGQPIYLEAQLYDEEVSLPLVVKALVYKNDGTLLATITLTHTEKGIFVNGAYNMPDEPVLFVKYYVFENDGTTPKTDDYGIIGEKFVKRLSASVNNVIGEPIVGEIFDSVTLSGVITDNEDLLGVVTGDTLIGVLTENETLEGVISDE